MKGDLGLSTGKFGNSAFLEGDLPDPDFSGALLQDFHSTAGSSHRWKNEAETSTKDRSKVNKLRDMNFNLSLRSPVMQPVFV